MNYERISTMTYAELRALEYDLNRVKCERSGFAPTTPEREADNRAFQLEYHAQQDADDQVRWEAKLRKRELDRQLAERKKPKPTVVFNVVDAYDSEDEPIGNLVRQNAVIGRKEKTAPPKPKTYFIPDVLWNFVKEYAGIYNLHINWAKKWSDIASHSALKHCPSIKAMTQKAFCKLGKENPEQVRRLVWRDLNCIRDVKDWKGDIIGNTREQTLKSLEYLAPLFHLPTWIVVGVEVQWYRCDYANDSTVCCGKVKKITNKNITIDVYKSVLKNSTSDNHFGADSYNHYAWEGKDKTATFSTDKGFRPRGDDNGWTMCIPFN